MSPYLKHIFPINIYHGTVEDNAAIKEQMLPLIEKYGNKHNFAPEGWLTNNLKTSYEDDDFNHMMMDKTTDIGKLLTEQYLPTLGKFFDANFSIEITDMWYNLYTNGEYQESHTHFGCWRSQNHFACIHFLSYNPEIHSPLKLHDPSRHIRVSSFEFFDGRSYADYVDVNAREGDFIMIPAYLEHEVNPGQPTPDYPRITISFNLRVADIDIGEDNDE